jgi:hypothetical protein
MNHLDGKYSVGAIGLRATSRMAGWPISGLSWRGCLIFDVLRALALPLHMPSALLHSDPM